MRFALLNEDQAYLLLTYSRNTARVRVLKVRLVKAFREARLCADTRKAEYLPTYHRMHDVIHDLASGSPNEKFVHANVNKLVNKVAGVEAGQRAKAPPAATIHIDRGAGHCRRCSTRCTGSPRWISAGQAGAGSLRGHDRHAAPGG